MLLRKLLLLGLGSLASTTHALDISLEDPDSIKEAAGTVAWGLVRFYSGNETGDVPGNLPDPYYWWLCGAMFGTLIDYWHYTGDDTYNDITVQALVHQAGDDRDLMPANQSRSMGNDDQGFWTLTAMTAAENLLPDPPPDQPQWLALVQAVFNEFVGRWDTEGCGGGLRWQVFPFHDGYWYKNSISNGCFFNLASRLARYTGNDSYAEWADKVWDWEVDIGLITDDWRVHDGVQMEDCPNDMDKNEWSYNSGIFLHGAAVMWNYTEDPIWRTRVEGLLEHGMAKFSKDGIVYEQYCEPHGICDDDQRSFKGYYLRWLAATVQLVPDLHDTIMPLIRKSAEAAASICVGTPTVVTPGHPPWDGHPGTACGMTWLNQGVFDNSYGVGEQMSALSALSYVLVDNAQSPRTNGTGGTSAGDPGAGKSNEEKLRIFSPLTIGDRVGAGFLTTFILAGVIGGTYFVGSGSLALWRET